MAAVLLEAGWNSAVDRIVYMDAPRDIRLDRIVAIKTPRADLARERQQPLGDLVQRSDIGITTIDVPIAPGHEFASNQH